MFGPRKGYFFPDYEDCRSTEMITEKQKRQLTAYILASGNESEEEKEEKIDALNELTQSEADDYIFETSRLG